MSIFATAIGHAAPRWIAPGGGRQCSQVKLGDGASGFNLEERVEYALGGIVDGYPAGGQCTGVSGAALSI